MEQMSEVGAARRFEEDREFPAATRASGDLVVRDRPPSPGGAATPVRMRGTRISVTDGPYAETKELLGGYPVIEAQ
jgi:hypothetical protein